MTASRSTHNHGMTPIGQCAGEKFTAQHYFLVLACTAMQDASIAALLTNHMTETMSNECL
jgi:hypothetical protein